VRVVIGEDEALLREGLVAVLGRAGYEVVAMAADGEDLVRKARAHEPDLVVADIRMPPSHTDDGLRAALEIRAGRPGTAILVLSQHLIKRYAFELL
jgi:DNA-binding NarL/FixJ family response regulator